FILDNDPCWASDCTRFFCLNLEFQRVQKMSTAQAPVLCLALLFVGTVAFAADDFTAAVVVLSETGFPAADSAAPSRQQLANRLPGSRFASTQQLAGALHASTAQLLVLPYGSVFPEQVWPEIHQFLERGGNLLVLGGRPFTRAAYRDNAGWRLRNYSTRFTRPLMIDQYQDTPGSEGLEFQTNIDVPLQLPRFAWKRAFSPIIRLSAVDLYQRDGAAGSLDARL